MPYSAEVILDSVSPAGDRLTTLVVTFPRIILAEFNTHRAFSRNSASSRAIPVAKQIERVVNDPFVPEQWGSNKAGMQAGELLPPARSCIAEKEWLKARAWAVEQAKALAFEGVHKQLTNRLLEPFMWHTVIVSATEWDNFFALRCHPDAQPEMVKTACLMRDALVASTPVERRSHRPYSEGGIGIDADLISAARCARVSYLGHDGKRDLNADISLANKLMNSGHWSPFEHVAHANPGRHANFAGWRQVRARLEEHITATR